MHIEPHHDSLPSTDLAGRTDLSSRSATTPSPPQAHRPHSATHGTRGESGEMMPGTLQRRDLVVGTGIAIVMAIVFSVVGGRPLVVTFVPGVAVSWLIFLRMYRRRTVLPAATAFIPVYFSAIAWQFLHFTEEFLTRFYDRFPLLYGVAPYSAGTFVSVNMLSYFVFVVACLLVFTKNLRFLTIPVLFFLVYGAIGNAIAHTWWVAMEQSYFPGFYTALAYWIIGPLVLSRLIGSRRDALIAVGLFAALLIPILTVFARPR